tara:strand:- start:252 stop:1112 length:861 start_codon:yes stop_codon:yes gene_type:complete
MENPLAILSEIIKQNHIDLSFNIIEIGAVQISDTQEPFYKLLDYFPSSNIIGFELEQEVCSKMNASAKKGVKYYPYALGKANEKRKLYITQNPMCSSLYKPNEELIKLYNRFEVAYLKEETEINTITLDHFIEQNKIGEIDFIKIDVQGAELDVFQGGKKTLNNVLKIVTEVEFIPHYINQPLFGDVCKYLEEHNLMFNKFLGLAGRALKPLILKNAITPSQHIWTDAVFIYHVQKIKNLTNIKLLKLSLLSLLYGSVDLTHFCLATFDEKNSTSFAKDFMTKAKN